MVGEKEENKEVPQAEVPKAEVPKADEKYILKEVITQTDTGIGLASEEGVFTEKGILMEILNKLAKIDEQTV